MMGTGIRITSVTVGIALCAALCAAPVAADPGYADPTGNKATITALPPLSPADRARIAAKDAAAARYAAMKRRTLAALGAHGARVPSAPLASGTSTAGAVAATYSAVTLSVTQQPQTTYYYCGPATVSEILGYRGHPASQSTTAGWLGTTTAGTAWYTGSSYPVPSVLTAHNGAGFLYEPHSLPSYPTSTDVTTFENAMFLDLDSTWPMAGNAYESKNGPHLVGHPVDLTILHWFAIRAYSGSGAYTGYADSVYNASSVTWHQSVPSPYSTMVTSTVVTILGARGYVF
jgi:hypothetical protein